MGLVCSAAEECFSSLVVVGAFGVYVRRVRRGMLGEVFGSGREVSKAAGCVLSGF